MGSRRRHSSLDGVSALPVVQEPDRPTELASGGPNAIAIALGLMSDEWNLQLLRFALGGATRYAEFRAELPISNSVLSGRLNWLTEAGLFERSQYEERPARYEYQLTARGRSTWQVLTAIWMWERRWFDRGGELPKLGHKGCSGDVEVAMGCSVCHEPAHARNVTGSFGPSGGWKRSVPAGATRRRSDDREAPQFPKTMSLLGNRWSSAIVGAMFQGVHAFKDFEALLEISPTLLSQRLTMLTENGIVAASPSEQRSDWKAYRLTEQGIDFFSVIAFVFDWAQSWFVAPEGPSFVMTHSDCSAEFHPELICTTCGRRADAEDLEVLTKSLV